MALVWTLSLPVSFASGAMSPRSYSPQHPTPDTGMSDDPRPYEIRRLLYQHSRPTLKAMDDDTIAKLAKEILNIADGSEIRLGPSGAKSATRLPVEQPIYG